MRCISIVMLLVWAATTGLASSRPQPGQPSAEGSSSATMKKIDASLDHALESLAPSAAGSGKPVLPEGLSLNDLDPATKASYLECLNGYFQYRLSGYEHRRRVFVWQLYSSVVIFVVVVALVFTAIYFSWLQFRQSLGPGYRKGAAGAEQPGTKAVEGAEPAGAKELAVTQLEASLQGIRLSSPVLGVVILLISLLFFYLYLIHVYPIKEIF